MVVLAASKDEGWDQIDSFLKKIKVRYNSTGNTKIFLDQESIASDKYNCHMYPETFLIGKNSIIIKKFVGAQDWNSEEMKKWVLQNLK